MRILRILVIFTVLGLLLGGCSGKKHQLFQKKETTQKEDNFFVTQKRYIIKPHDRLSIIFFEYPELSTKNKDQSESDIGIEVASDGTVMLPIVGKVLVAGRTKEDVVDLLYKKYSDYLEKPALRVEILNQKVYVLGEVKNPGIVEMMKFRSLTPLKAIVQRGGLTDFAQRNRVKIVRGTRAHYTVLDIDLTNLNNIKDNNINLLPDDIIYVPHNGVKDFNLPLSGADPSLNWINTIFNSLTMYQVWK